MERLVGRSTAAKDRRVAPRAAHPGEKPRRRAMEPLVFLESHRTTEKARSELGIAGGRGKTLWFVESVSRQVLQGRAGSIRQRMGLAGASSRRPVANRFDGQPGLATAPAATSPVGSGRLGTR